MGEAGTAPTVRQIVLGRRLEHLRERAEMSPPQAAEVIRVATTSIRRMEKAQVGLKYAQVKGLLEAYGCSPHEIDDFLQLVVEAGKPGWWHRFRDVLPDWFRVYVSLESAASLVRCYEPHFVPGLLQTEEYARTLLKVGFPHSNAEVVERRVRLRMERQELLTRPDAPRLWAVLDETVLRRPIGGAEVMRAQVDRLIEAVATLQNVTVQVVPFEVGAHPAMFGPFHMFRIAELPDVVYSESLAGAAYIDDEDDVRTYLEALDRMCAQAVPVQHTEDFLKNVRKEI